MEKNQGIYKITCLANNKVYIGASKNIKLRIYQHMRELEKQMMMVKEMKKDYLLYGKNSFKAEVIEYVDDARLLADKEIYHIKRHENIYNKRFDKQHYNFRDR